MFHGYIITPPRPEGSGGGVLFSVPDIYLLLGEIHISPSMLIGPVCLSLCLFVC